MSQCLGHAASSTGSYYSDLVFLAAAAAAAVNTTVICPDPVSEDCVTTKGPDACLAAAYDKVNPDNDIPCSATDGFTFHQCLANPKCNKIVLLQPIQMNLTTCPSNEIP